MDCETSYLCGICGEEIIIPVDVSAGSWQQYVEDCPVCCHPNLIHVEIDDEGNVVADSSIEDHS